MAEGSGEEAKSTWDASQYEAALGHLAKLQAQLDGLRATIPSIVSPLANSGGNRAAMFAETREVALRSTSRLHTFRDNWSSDETQDLLKKGKESLQNNSDLSKAVDVSKWGWGEDSDEEKWKVPCDTQQLSTEMI